MREKNLFSNYPKPKNPRIVGENLRTVEHRIIASKRGQAFFDGHRNYGYGGYKYDGRWRKIARDIVRDYGLKKGSNVLQINSEKGFLLYDLKESCPEINVFGTESSQYGIEHTINTVKKNILMADPINLPFPDSYFDFVIGVGVVYSLTISDAVLALKEIIRVSKNKSFITLASYENQEDYFLFKQWTLLGTTILKKAEWLKLLKYCNYQGDYCFTNSATLELVR